jgi:hypothetical protein
MSWRSNFGKKFFGWKEKTYEGAFPYAFDSKGNPLYQNLNLSQIIENFDSAKVE